MDVKIGWIGTGVMGASMCMHILERGIPVFVHNRTRRKAHGLLQNGAEWCNTPEDVARQSNIIFTIVGYPSDVNDVILGKQGVLAGAAEGSVIVDMTTSEPSLAGEIYDAALTRSVGSVDAPVSGGDVGAREGRLAIMAGGDRNVYERVLPFFEMMGGDIAYMGGPGMGQHTKMSNQILIASTMVGVVESLMYAYRAGLDLSGVIDVIGKGAASSWSINNLGRRIVNRDFDPGFFIKHFIKDMGIALAEAGRMKIALPGLALAEQFYRSAAALGMEDMGTQALYRVLENMNINSADPDCTGE